jgi:hypothetical protein
MFAKNFNSPVVDRLFTVLYSLCNLLIVKPANLQEIASGDSLVIISPKVTGKVGYLLYIKIKPDNQFYLFYIQTVLPHKVFYKTAIMATVF